MITTTRCPRMQVIAAVWRMMATLDQAGRQNFRGCHGRSLQIEHMLGSISRDSLSGKHWEISSYAGCAEIHGKFRDLAGIYPSLYRSFRLLSVGGRRLLRTAYLSSRCP